MTTPGRYAASDGSFARSTGNAAARGVLLIAVAVVIGVFLLSQGFDSPSGVAAGPDAPTTTAPSTDTTDTTGNDDTTTTLGEDTSTTQGSVTVDPVTTRPAGEVKVVVANGTGAPGVAGAAKTKLTTAGYVAEAENAAVVPTELSSVYYVDGYAEEAKGVAAALGGTLSLLRAAPADPLALIKSPEGLEDFHVFVVIGDDDALG